MGWKRYVLKIPLRVLVMLHLWGGFRFFINASYSNFKAFLS